MLHEFFHCNFFSWCGLQLAFWHYGCYWFWLALLKPNALWCYNCIIYAILISSNKLHRCLFCYSNVNDIYSKVSDFINLILAENSLYCTYGQCKKQLIELFPIKQLPFCSPSYSDSMNNCRIVRLLFRFHELLSHR